jgi:hypothetical protein
MDLGSDTRSGKWDKIGNVNLKNCSERLDKVSGVQK